MSPGAPTQAPLTPLNDAVAALQCRLAPVPAEHASLAEARGRVLAEDLVADRPSPAVDVSEMDGYAVRAADTTSLTLQGLPVAGEAAIGAPVATLPPGAAMRIFTGGPVPLGADAVVKREDLIETKQRITLRAGVGPVAEGLSIRRAGENARAGDLIAPSGTILSPAAVAALAAFGAVRPLVRRRVRVAVVVTGEEIAAPNETPTPTRIRDSNGPMLAAMLGDIAWVQTVRTGRVGDDPAALRAAIGEALRDADCVITTGGVSMGDHDHVPAIAAALGGDTVFHRLAIKPGKPVFAAVFDDKRVLIGLPGNPVSATVTARVVALPALAALAGAPASTAGPGARCEVENPDGRALLLTRFALAERTGPDRVRLIIGQGSGDVAALARSDGVVRIPPGNTGPGSFPYYAWRIS